MRFSTPRKHVPGQIRRVIFFVLNNLLDRPAYSFGGFIQREMEFWVGEQAKTTNSNLSENKILIEIYNHKKNRIFIDHKKIRNLNIS